MIFPTYISSKLCGTDRLCCVAGEDSDKVQDSVRAAKARYDTVDGQCAHTVDLLNAALPVTEAFRDSRDKLAACLHNIEAELKSLDPALSNVEELLEVLTSYSNLSVIFVGISMIFGAVITFIQFFFSLFTGNMQKSIYCILFNVVLPQQL